MVQKFYAYIQHNDTYREVSSKKQYFSITFVVETILCRSVEASDVKQEILDILKPHEELLAFDMLKVLRLKKRHKITKLTNNIRVKGHMLSETTMRIAVPVINISIYLNPTLSFLIKPAIVTIAIGMDKIKLGNVEII